APSSSRSASSCSRTRGAGIAGGRGNARSRGRDVPLAPVRRLLIRDLAQVATPEGIGAPLRGESLRRVDVLEDAYVLCEDGRVAAVGRMRDLDPLESEVEELDGRGLVAIPALVDCHTHACFVG